jgi:HPr kinase/phosphorylase
MTPSHPGVVLQHGTALNFSGMAVLLRGRPGAGKSDLALQLIDQPGYGIGQHLLTATLIADDQVVLTRKEHQLLISCPATIQNLLEIRGLGLVTMTAGPAAPLVLVVDLLDHIDIPRLPEDREQTVLLCGLTFPRLMLDPRTPSAPARLRAALQHLGCRP